MKTRKIKPRIVVMALGIVTPWRGLRPVLPGNLVILPFLKRALRQRKIVLNTVQHDNFAGSMNFADFAD